MCDVRGRPGAPGPAAAVRVPLIRDETGTVIAGAAHWAAAGRAAHRPRRGRRRRRAAVRRRRSRCADRADRRRCPDCGPGCMAGRLRRSRWVSGRAVQLGTTGAIVVRDGVATARPARRSTFYRHTEGWLRVGAADIGEVSVPARQSVRPSPIFLAMVALTAAGGALAWASARADPAAGLRRGVRLRHRGLAGVAVPARVRPRVLGVPVRRPRRRGARLPHAQPAEVLASAAVAGSAGAVHRARRDRAARRCGVRADRVS